MLLFFTFSGSAFHAVSAAYVNALLSKVFVFVFGTFNVNLFWKNNAKYGLLKHCLYKAQTKEERRKHKAKRRERSYQVD